MRGFSLFETVLAVALASLLILLLSLFGPPTVRAWIQSSRQSQAQRTAMVAVLALRSEYREACVPSLSCSGGTVRFLSRRTTDGALLVAETGQPLWQKWVSFESAGGALERRYDALTTPSVLVSPLTFQANPAPVRHVVARGLEYFRAQATAKGLLKISLRARCEEAQASLEITLASDNQAD